MTEASAARPAIRFRGRSFLAMVLAPVPPLDAWLRLFDDVLDVTALRCQTAPL